jgi:D-alanyl-D-alanine carboxypeptidase
MHVSNLINNAVKQTFPGLCAAFFRPDCGLFETAAGRANIATGRKMTPKDHFRLASCSKPFIGVVIMQLAQEGKLSLDDPISGYLPAKIVTNIANADKATIRQLMNHTSGCYDYFNRDFSREAESHPGKKYSAIEALEFAFNKPAAFTPPGSSYYYSNTNTILLGMIIESVLQISFTRALQERIFQPLALNETYNDYNDEALPPLARGYFYQSDGRRKDYTEINQGYGLADGVIVTTGGDIVKFLRGLLREKRLLKPEYLAEMLKVEDAAKKAQEGLNIFVYSDFNNGEFGKMIGHDGEYAGYKTEMFYFPDRDVIVVLLTNCSGKGVDGKWHALFQEITAAIAND